MTAPRDVPPEPLSSARPWGGFLQLTSDEPVTVKVMTVMPGQRLSRQRHAKRAEYWLVLDDGLQAWVDDEAVPSQRGATVWIPCGSVHRLGNVGSTAGRVLEVAFGEFDEDDIERLDDDYAR
jgi:mannose-1-phosphate guanylyltransferase/mannose-6-phosphate isomerase